MSEGRPDFETIEHTADIGLRVRGATLEALFANAARGMFRLIAGEAGVAPERRFTMEVEAPDREALLVAWLNELLFHFETKHLLLSEFEVLRVTGERVTATVGGGPLEEVEGPLEMELKAATYHGLRVAETEVGWEAEVLFDV